MEPARSGCPINAAVEAFGDSWSLLVLRDVMFGNKRYFRELLRLGSVGVPVRHHRHTGDPEGNDEHGGRPAFGLHRVLSRKEGRRFTPIGRSRRS